MATPPSASRRKGGKRQAPSENLPAQSMEPDEPLSKKAKVPDEVGKLKIKKELLEEGSDSQGPLQEASVSSIAAKPARKTFDWTTEDLSSLISNIAACLPKSDNIKYSTLIEKLDWEKVRFSTYSGSECKEKWMQIMTRLRRFRTLTDMVVDAKEWLKHPWASYSNSKKQKHPDLPKKPLTPYFRYFLEKREKYSREHPDLSMTDLAKILSKKFQQLPDKKKQKYKDSYERENETYKETLEKFKKEHPEEFPAPESRSSGSSSSAVHPPHEGPTKPMTPYQLFQLDRLKRPEYTQLDKKEATERIRKQWNALSDGKRIKWIRKTVQEEHRYEAELLEYQEMHPEFKPETFKPVLSKVEKELKDRYDGKPERPPNSGYSLFSKIMLRELKDVPSKEKMAEISKRWKILTDSDRLEYNKQAQKANQKYKEKYQIYLNSLVSEDRKKLEGELALKNKKKAPTPNQIAATEKMELKKNPPVAVAPPTPLPILQANGVMPKPPTTKSQKKGFTPLLFYQQEKFNSILQKNPSLSKTEIMRLLAKDFSDLPDKKKEKYKKMVDEAKNLTEQPIHAAPAVSKKEPVESSKKPKLFKGEPKKPPQSGYGVFSTEMLSVLTNIDPKLRMAEIAKRWRSMTDPEKEKYKKKAQDMLKKYNKDLHKFLSNLPEEELKTYYKLRAKGAKKGPQGNKLALSAASSKQVKEEKKSDSDSSDGDDDDSSDGSEEQSGDGSGSGSEESGSDSDDDDDSDEEKKVTLRTEDKNDTSSGDSDSESESGSGSSDDSSDSGSDSEEE